MHLTLEDGNAHSILVRCRRAAVAAGWPEEAWGAFYVDATGGDYDHLLMTVARHFEVE